MAAPWLHPLQPEKRLVAKDHRPHRRHELGSSAEYYRLINQGVRAWRGGLHSARCLLWSFDLATIEALQDAGRWDDAATELIGAAQRLERAGADFLVICTNTMHRLADQMQAATLPILHIADPTAGRIRNAGLVTVGDA